MFGQMNTYDKKASLSDISEQWHKIPLKDFVFKDTRSDLKDIRIYGITANDTLEAPYILNILKGETRNKKVDFKLLNSSSNAKGYYFTYQIPSVETINEIQLDFQNSNFDWKIVLEGSQNQKEWFTILDDYRIVAITNDQTSYRFTNLNFKDSNYNYYRVLVKSDTKPNLNTAMISNKEIVEPSYKKYKIRTFITSEKEKTTVVDIDLQQRVPISNLKLNIDDSVDYYRSITISYVTDSIITEKGPIYNYSVLTNGTLSSLEKNEFTFPSVLAKTLRIIVHNYDNQPLKISSAEVMGYLHSLTARFTEPAKYYLVYGKEQDRKPIYDISANIVKIPKDLSTLNLIEVQNIPKPDVKEVSPLFENKWWLWGIMGVLMLVLGGFTLKMMQKKN